MSSKKFVAVNVFYGDEVYLLDRAKEKGLSWPDRQVTFLDGKDTSEDILISALDDITMDGEGMVVVLDNAEKVKLTKAFHAYLESRYPEGSTPDTSMVLVALVRSGSLPKDWVGPSSKGRVVSYTKFKPWEEAKILKRVEDEAKRLGVVLSSEAFTALYRVYAEDTGGMANELNKLSFLVGKGETVTKDHVLSVCSRQIPVMPWDVSEAASRKSAKKALTLAGLLFRYEGEGAAVPIVASLMKQVEKLLIARSLLDQGKSTKEISSAINMSPYIYEKKYSSIVSKHTSENLFIEMKKLCELEVRIKGPAPSKRTLVDLALLSLAK